MTDSEKEQIKLRAAYLNGASLILLSLGGLTPFFIAYQSGDLPYVMRSLIFLGGGAISSWEVHRLAQKHLAKLDVKDLDP